MSETIITKRCSHCKEIKPLSEFYKDKSRKNGYGHSCKICEGKRKVQYQKTEKGKRASQKRQRKYDRSAKGKVRCQEYRQSEKGKLVSKKALQKYRRTVKGKIKYQKYKANHPERRKAKDAVNNAIKVGELPRASIKLCSYCPKPAQEYHHWSYAPQHWLDVIPVCIPCHKKLPNQLKIIA